MSNTGVCYQPFSLKSSFAFTGRVRSRVQAGDGEIGIFGCAINVNFLVEPAAFCRRGERNLGKDIMDGLRKSLRLLLAKYPIDPKLRYREPN